MVISDESGGLGCDQNSDGNDAKPQPPPSQHENGESSKQNSIFSLTLDEIQSKSGKSFGSMNMDEFLANIWSVDENQVCEEQPNQGDHEDPSNDGKDTTSKTGSLSRQGSFSIPTPLCKKTVDEVWSEIDKTQPPPPPNNMNINPGPPQRQPTIGEITLEDFLVKAGIVQERPQNGMESTTIQPHGGNTNNCNVATSSSTYGDTSFGMGNNLIGSGFFNPQGFVPNNLSGNGYATAPYPMFGERKMGLGETSCGGTSTAIEKCHSLPESSGTNNKKRIIDGPPEVLVERRQRRMIKNRESAARSRARKQAYTVELEAELNQLQDENIKLKQCLAEIEQRRKQEVMRRKRTTKAQKMAAKLKTIRRSVSA
ncbi:ABSCISIC ACID-INSENSITIVE 5-like protein 1 [Rosa chinensis]|uniref:ABSCISIC ACID-INSENSITIVE 5-like protein 1 n=1 Tax=Rosa chinensis TaxID=74649 RepID=UPI001AD8CA11|nr:ABSCISIC ACID-INSENSITIVE 5-like protein 1 [Rosa chinensis]